MSKAVAAEPNAETRGMPPVETLCARTVTLLITEAYANSLMRLGRPTLNELGRRIMEPGADAKEVLEWLKGEGHEVKRSGFYRFVQRFRECYKTVWSGIAKQLLVVEMAENPAHTTEDLHRITKQRAASLVAQMAITTDAADMDLRKLSAILSAVEGGDKLALERDKLALAERQADDRATKLQAEVERLQLDTEEKRQAQQARLDAEKAKLAAAEATPEGGAMTPADVVAILDRVMKGEAA